MTAMIHNSFERFVQKLGKKADLRAGNPEKDTIYTGDIVTINGMEVGYVLDVEEDTVMVELGGQRMNLDRNQFGKLKIPDCNSCSNLKVYSDSSEDWKCPFCEL